MAGDRPLLGILLMLGFCILAPLQDSMAKILGAFIPLYLLLLVRFGVQGLMLWPLCRALGHAMALPRHTLGWAWLRAAFHIAGIGAMFTALQFLPIADAIAIAFVMPFLMLLLGWLFLGEEVGIRRILACAVGFVGVLMVVQPAFEEVGPPALLPLLVACVFAGYMLATRKIAKDVDPIVLQATGGAMAVTLLVPIGIALWLTGVPLLPARPLEGWMVAMLAGVGVLGTGAHLLMSWSLRFAPSATLAPMQYLEIPIATLVGWMIFGDLPDGLAAMGISVIVAAGLYIILREQATARRAAAPPPAS
jgi:drug/metabolite transporter (DMT)-like permease